MRRSPQLELQLRRSPHPAGAEDLRQPLGKTTDHCKLLSSDMDQIVFQDGNAHPKHTAAFRLKLVTTAKCFGKINCQISKSVSCSWLSQESAVIVVLKRRASATAK